MLFGVTTLAAAWLVRPDLMLVEHVRFEVRASHGGSTASPLGCTGRHHHLVVAEVCGSGRATAPWVRAAHAEVQWPDALVVTVEEFVPVATVLLEDGRRRLGERRSSRPRAPTSIFLSLRVFVCSERAIRTSRASSCVRRSPRLLLDDRGLLFRRQVAEVSFGDGGTDGSRRQRSWVAFGLQNVEARVDRLAALIAEGLAHRAWRSISHPRRSLSFAPSISTEVRDDALSRLRLVVFGE